MNSPAVWGTFRPGVIVTTTEDSRSDAAAAHDLIWTDETVQRFWSYYADKTHAYFAESFGGEVVRRMANFLPKGCLCVDYGCGSGGLSAALLGAGYRVAAADHSLDAVARVRQRFAGRPGFLGAWHTGAILGATDPAEAVFSLETIEHVTDAGLAAYFTAIRALAKPEGIVIVTTPYDEDIEAAKVFCPESGAVFHPMQHVRSFDTDSLAAVLATHGLRPLEVYATDFGVSVRTPKRWVADKGKRLLGMGTRPPHLVAVARRSAT
jgi:2-polyprenyl-3-methyl-5-hydroxy-6-metoxy-1,4-benzoquinol methylase